MTLDLTSSWGSILTSGIVGTTLCLTIYAVMLNIPIFQKWKNPTIYALTPSFFFLLSVYSTILFIVFERAFFIDISLIFIFMAISLVFLLIWILFQLPKHILWDKMIEEGDKIFNEDESE